MWTVVFILNLAVLYNTASSSPPSPIKVVFSSVNLRNVLQWSPGNGTSEDTVFTVQYAIYGDSVEGSKGKRVHWRTVPHCTDIVRSWCDLSSQTRDDEQGYFARVRAGGRGGSSKWTVTQRRFDPKLDTTLGPPQVSVEIEGNNAIISLKGPMRYQPINHTPVVSMATVYPQMTYNLSINIGCCAQPHFVPVVSSPYKLRLMQHKTEYCFSAKTKMWSMPLQSQSSAVQCITTPEDPEAGRLQMVVLGTVLPILCIFVLAVVGYFLHKYLMGEGQKSPYNLNPSSFHPPPLTITPGNVNVILISVIKDESSSDTDSAISDPVCHKQKCTDLPPRYSPQRPETPPVLDDLSVDYGFVGVAPQIIVGGDDEAGERKQHRREDGNDLNGNRQKCIAKDGYEKNVWTVEEDRSAGDYAPQANSYLSQTSRQTCTRAHGPIGSQAHAQTERSTLVQAQAWSQLSETPQTGVSHAPLNLQTNMREGIRGEMDRMARVGTTSQMEAGSESETVSLLSAYASQNVVPITHNDESNFLPDDYGVLSTATANITEENEKDEAEEEDEGSFCINWEPKTRKLVFPDMTTEYNKKGVLDWVVLGDQKDEEEQAVKGELTLANVFIRQESNEEAEALRETARGGGTGSEEDDIFTKWDLVVSMDQ